MNTISTRTVVISELEFYKVIDAAKETVQNYNAGCISCQMIRTSEICDWSGLYTQFKSAHALGTLPYRWENDLTSHASLVRVTIHTPIRIVVLDGALWHSGNVTGKTKAELAKQELAVPMDEPLVAFLGRFNTALLVQETAEEPELIFSHDFFAALNKTEHTVALFRRQGHRPVTSQWKYPDDHDWKTWNNDGHEYPLKVPDLNVDFV